MKAAILSFVGALFISGCTDGDSIQFTLQIDRSFHRPIEFRAQQDGPTVILRTIVYSGRGGYQKGAVASDKSRPLTPEEIEAVRAKLRALKQSNPSDLQPADARDGATWTFSGNRGRMKAWSPKSEDWIRGTRPLFELGLLLWRCGKVEEPEGDLY
jgi:hypothetical protein